MTHKPRFHALRACVSETLFTLSDWLFDAGYTIRPPEPDSRRAIINLHTIRAMTGEPEDWNEVRASLSEGNET